MPKLTKWRAAFFVLIGVISVGFIFWQPFSAIILEKYLQNYCRKCWNGEFQSTNISYNEGAWIIEKPFIATKTPLEMGGKQFTAERIKIKDSWNILDRQILLDIEIINPQIYIGSGQIISTKSDPSGSPFLIALPNFPLMSVLGSVNVSQGVLNAPQKILPFQFHGDWGNGVNGNLKLWLEDFQSLDNQIGVTFSEKKADRFINIDFVHASCPLLKKSLDPVLPFLTDWEVISGNIHGHMSFHNNLLTGDTQIQDLIVKNKNLQIHGDIPVAHFHIEEPVANTIVGSFELLQKASINGPKGLEIADITGGAFFEQSNKMRLNLEGTAIYGSASFPIKISNQDSEIQMQVTGRGFAQDQFLLKANVQKIPSGMHFAGVIETLENTFPQIGFEFDLKNQIGIENGRFETKNISLNTFAKVPNLVVEGEADVQGTFDNEKISLEYQLRDFSLDHPYFIFSMDQPLDPAIIVSPGKHSFNFHTGEHQGSLPIHNATYTDKKTGLCFSGINSNTDFDSKFFHATEVETFCNGLYFSGNVDVNFSHILDGYVDVNIHSNTMEGKVSNLKEMVSKFQASAFLHECPFEGNVAFHRDGGHLRFQIEPQKVEIDCHLEGTLSEGLLTCRNNEIVLRDLSTNFEYDRSKKTLAFQDIQGYLLVGSSQNVEEYVFAGEHIRLKGTETEFDIWIGDRTRDVIRFAGTTHVNSDEDIEFHLDKTLTHFGDVHPELFQLELRDWSHVEKFRLVLGFQLKNLLQDVKRFAKTGLIFSKGWLKGLNHLKIAEGDFQLDFQYDDKIAQFTCDLKGNQVTFEDFRFKTCLLNWKKKGNSWTLDQLQLDDLSLAADVTENEDSWRVNFIGIRYGESLLAGFEGKFFPNENLLDGKINLLDVDLAKVDEWPSMKPFAEKFHPRGRIHATGSGQVIFSKERPFWNAEASMIFGLQGCEMNGMGIQNIENVPCKYTSNQGIEIRNLKTVLVDPQTNLAQASVNLAQANYNIAHHEIIVDGLQFNIPALSLPWIASRLHQNFSESVNPYIADVIGHIKQSGSLEGSLNVTRGEQHRTVKLSLADGKYHFNQSDYDLRNVVLEYDPLELRLRSLYQYHNQPLEILLRTKSLSMDSGELVLKSGEDSQLFVNWLTDSNLGLMLQRVEGNLEGISVRLGRSTQSLRLSGEVIVDVSKAVHYLPLDLLSLISQMQVKGQYSLKGDWILPYEDNFQFTGHLKGEQCQLQGYCLNSLNCHVIGSSKGIQMNSLNITDPSGKLESEQIVLVRDPLSHWVVQSKLVTLTQFKPSQMKFISGASKDYDPAFTIKNLEINDLYGELFSPHTFLAHGKVHIVNPPKAIHVNQFVNVSMEKASQMGIDLSALNPVSGTIEYEMKQGRIYLKKLVDMYSAGKVSRFYLPKDSSETSYIDFDGNIRMKVRMKQHNLLFKLAELFTVNVEGTLMAPKFSLFKSDSEE